MREYIRNIYHNLHVAIGPRLSMQLQHYRNVGRWPNLDQPSTFNEKLLARKLTENNPLFVQLADKVLVKDYVAETVGSAAVIPTLWAGTELPSDAAVRFDQPLVIKANHLSGHVEFVHNPDRADWARLQSTVAGWLAEPYNPWAHERWYNRINRQVLVESFIGTNGVAPTDYKFFVFEGRVQLIQVGTDKYTSPKLTFYSSDWVKQNVALGTIPTDPRPLAPPPHLAEMIAMSVALAGNFPFVRVDLYDLPDGPRFGELTFCPNGGFLAFTPWEYDKRLGDYWTGPVG